MTAGRRVARRSRSGQLPGFLLGSQHGRSREERSVKTLGKGQHGSEKGSLRKGKIAAPSKRCEIGNVTLRTKAAQ